MAAVTAEPEVDQVDVETNADPAQDPQPKRKRRTFTMSEEAYATLTATSQAQGTNRSPAHRRADPQRAPHRHVVGRCLRAADQFRRRLRHQSRTPSRGTGEPLWGNPGLAITRARKTSTLVDVLASERIIVAPDPFAGSGTTRILGIDNQPGLRIADASGRNP